MFDLKSLRRFTWPARGSREYPAALASAALILLLALQAALPSRTELPADSGLAPRRARSGAVAAIPAYPALSRRDIFTPGGLAASSGGDAPTSLDARQAVGVFMTGRRIGALIKTPGASAQLVTVGQSIDGWRVARIEPDAVILDRGRERRRMVVGAPPLAAAQPSSTSPASSDAETSP